LGKAERLKRKAKSEKIKAESGKLCQGHPFGRKRQGEKRKRLHSTAGKRDANT